MTELLALDIAMRGKINVYNDLKDQLSAFASFLTQHPARHVKMAMEKNTTFQILAEENVSFQLHLENKNIRRPLTVSE